MNFQRLLESIDLLIESPESLGLPKIVGDQIRKQLKYRKAQDYIGLYFKEWNFYSNQDVTRIINGASLVIKRTIEPEDAEYLANKLGLAYDYRKSWERQMGDESIPPSFWPKRLSTWFKEVHTVEQFLRWQKKAQKASNNRRGLKRLNKFLTRYLSEIFHIFQKTIKELISFLNSEANAYREIKGLNRERAERVAVNVAADSKLDENKKIVEFPDGFFWYKVEGRKECELEGKRMQHCGEVSRSKHMYSLRDKKNDPHVTVDYSPRDYRVTQIRGKQNKTPVKKYWSYIDDLMRALPRKRILFRDKETEDRGSPRYEEFQTYMANLDMVVVSEGDITKSAIKAVKEEGRASTNNKTFLEDVFIEGTDYADEQMVCHLAYILELDDIDGDLKEQLDVLQTLEQREPGLIAAMNNDWRGTPLALTRSDYGFKQFLVKGIDVRDEQITVTATVGMLNEPLMYSMNIIELAEDMEVLLSEKGRKKLAELLSDKMEKIFLQ